MNKHLDFLNMMLKEPEIFFLLATFLQAVIKDLVKADSVRVDSNKEVLAKVVLVKAVLVRAVLVKVDLAKVDIIQLLQQTTLLAQYLDNSNQYMIHLQPTKNNQYNVFFIIQIQLQLSKCSWHVIEMKPVQLLFFTKLFSYN